MHPVDEVVEQLWAPALHSPDLRVVTHPLDDPEWVDVERYWLLPNAARARLLVAVGSARVTQRLLTNYRRLRNSRTNAIRAGYGGLAAVGAPLSRDVLRVQVRRDNPAAAQLLPLHVIADALGGLDLAMATGVRTSDNRKATLHLADARSGAPVGYAKIGWTSATDAMVRTESDALLRLAGGSPTLRTPRLLAVADYQGHPVAVSSPLPLDARAVLSGPTPPPQVLAGPAPLIRWGAARTSGRVVRMLDSLRDGVVDPRVRSVAEPALDLLTRVTSTSTPLPVVSLAHGDLTPWNAALDGSRTWWLWDWETAEPDAVAGVDALQWWWGVQRLEGMGSEPHRLRECLHRAAPTLTALGLHHSDHPLLGALFAVTVAERACAHARLVGGWEGAFAGPADLRTLVGQAACLLRHPHGSLPPA